MTASETVRLLNEKIRRLESAARPSEPAIIPLGVLSELFPGGLAAGSLIELLPRVPGAGAWTLALLLAQYACGERKTLLLTDHERCFYPPAARKFGFDPQRAIIVRPRTAREALSALVQALRCSALGTAIGAFERLDDRDNRRLQLAAEAGGVVGVLLRPLAALHTPSFAALRLLLEPLPSVRDRRRIKVEVLRRRNSTNARPAAVGLEIDDATGHVRPLSLMELAADAPAAARTA